MRKTLKTCFFILVALFLVYCAARVYYKLTDDFREGNYSYDLSKENKWNLPQLSGQELIALREIFDQTFYYLDKGAQSYVFESADGQYIFKMFKFKHLRPSWIVSNLPNITPFKDYKQDIIEKKKKLLHSVLDGYELAYLQHQDDTGIIFLHLKPTNYLNQKITLYNKMGIKYELDLDKLTFVLQKKGEILRANLNKKFKNNDIPGVKESITKILDMYVREYQKGTYDRDHGVMHNTGFIRNQPFHLDVGKFTHDPTVTQTERYSADLKHIVWKIDLWIKNNHPEHYSEISSFIAKQYYRLTGSPFDPSSIDPAQYKKRQKAWYRRNLF